MYFSLLYTWLACLFDMFPTPTPKDCVLERSDTAARYGEPASSHTVQTPRTVLRSISQHQLSFSALWVLQKFMKCRNPPVVMSSDVF